MTGYRRTTAGAAAGCDLLIFGTHDAAKKPDQKVAA
jgi:hypothetical protein